jgi:peptide-methionine (R)-S-oxide reductase
MDKIRKSDEEWRRSLTPEQYRILRQKGTERPFTGQYAETSTPGVYLCSACGLELFSSETKFNAGCGWPSFSDPLHKEHVAEIEDRSHGMVRTEVTCSRCGGHLGHVFPDGPQPSGLRYCINSASLHLNKKQEP